ncbi:hypothetical protein [Bradyrhizobium japonicum]|uniref:hypothetical protein n=1 Tax=Bradyrhizobium japonicum TaxID=375 RepID=UPI001BAA6796|nr:hypothetical protein [Bradyrhizobium japonicum]MBR0960890.1 hypothetical protein [Bradyrhizobium japonicum]
MAIAQERLDRSVVRRQDISVLFSDLGGDGSRQDQQAMLRGQPPEAFGKDRNREEIIWDSQERLELRAREQNFNVMFVELDVACSGV